MRVEEEEVIGAQADTGRHGQCMVTQGVGRDRRYQGASEGIADSIGSVNESGCGRSSSPRSGRRFERSSKVGTALVVSFMFRLEILPKVA